MNMATGLVVHRCDSTVSLGQEAAACAAAALRESLRTKPRARVLLAAAPSQEATLTALAQSGLPFERIDFFHMDDYVGLPGDAPQGFGNWLDSHFFRLLGTDVAFFKMDTDGDADDAAAAYARRIGGEDFDVTFCGLGVNAHLAFNDPPADFDDPLAVRAVSLSEASRQQQVDEGHFSSLDAVPAQAITVTIPRLLAARVVICSTPGAAKRRAVSSTLASDPDADVPGTALKLHPEAHLFVDFDSCPKEAHHV